MYRYGRRQGQKQTDLVKKEIKTYVEEELPRKVLDGIRGLFGPIGKGGAEMAKEETIEWAQKNPEILALVKGVAVKGGARWMGKKLFGLSKKEIDALIGMSPQLPITEGMQESSAPITPKSKY